MFDTLIEHARMVSRSFKTAQRALGKIGLASRDGDPPARQRVPVPTLQEIALLANRFIRTAAHAFYRPARATTSSH